MSISSYRQTFVLSFVFLESKKQTINMMWDEMDFSLTTQCPKFFILQRYFDSLSNVHYCEMWKHFRIEWEREREYWQLLNSFDTSCNCVVEPCFHLGSRRIVAFHSLALSRRMFVTLVKISSSMNLFLESIPGEPVLKLLNIDMNRELVGGKEEVKVKWAK